MKLAILAVILGGIYLSRSRRSALAGLRIDPKQLRRGARVEREHTRSPRKARKIARDHLREECGWQECAGKKRCTNRYYIELAKMERKLKRMARR